MTTVQREQLEADVLIVGAGPAGLACALHLANLIKKQNEGGGSGGPSLSKSGSGPPTDSMITVLGITERFLLALAGLMIGVTI